MGVQRRLPCPYWLTLITRNGLSVDNSFFFPRNYIPLSREALVQDSLHLICVQCSINILGADLSPGGLSSRGMLGLPGPLSWCIVLSLCSLKACSPRHPTLHGIVCQKLAPRANPGSQIACTQQNSHDQEGPWGMGACWLMQHPDL